MADTDHRRDHRGGGGRGGRGGGGMKRKRYGREDDDNEHGHRDQRRRPTEAPPGTRIRRDLLDLAEDVNGREPSNIKESAITIAKLAAGNWDDEYVRDVFVSMVLKLIVEQPLKIPVVAAVVLYANAEKAETAQRVISQAGADLQQAIESGDWRVVKLLLRFLACSTQLFEEDGIWAIFDELFDRAVDLQTASSDDAVGIELVKIILLTLPYLIASSTSDTARSKASEILEKTEIVATAPHGLEHLVDPYTVAEGSEKPMAFGSVVSILQRQLQGEATDDWPLACILRVFDPASPVESNGDRESIGAAAHEALTKHAYPTINIPSPVIAGPRALFPEIFFSLYADQEIQSVPPTSNIASSLVRDSIVDTVNILDYNRNATARYLTELDNFWAPGTFTRRETQFDRLRDYEGEASTWKPEDVAIDSVFSQIFQLPSSQHRLVYYHSVITEVCKLSPSAIAPSLGRAIRFLYRGIDSMDLELSYRFMDWFAHHLSNFEFRWKWTEWQVLVGDTDLPDIHPKKAFINGALDKEIRLSFAKRIRETLPKEFQHLVPASKEKDTPDFKFADDSLPYAAEAREVLGLLKKKAPEEDIQKILDTVQEQATSHGVADPLVPSTDVYMTAILNLGSKSLSHVLSTIDRCKERLLAVGPQSEPGRRQIISSVVDFWADHPGNAANIVDKLLNYSIVTPMSVIEWALQDRLDRGRALASAQMYELVSTTMFKVTDRLRQIVAQRSNTAVPFEQRQQIDEVLPRERQSTRDMYEAIEEAVAGIASGVQDQMLERYDDDDKEQAIVKQWGERWARVWRRKAAVEETVVGEAAVPELVEPVPEPEMVAPDAGMDVVDDIA